jgi:membrane-associated phospholipid phosphatase
LVQPLSSRTKTLLLAATSLATLVLAAVARGAGPLPGDLRVARLVQGTPPSNATLGSVLDLLSDAMWVAPVVALLASLLLRRWRFAGLLVAATLGSSLLAETLKRLVGRPRPSDELVRVLEPADGFGFPSSTTLLAVVLFALLSYQARMRPGAGRARRAAAVLSISLIVVALISFGRVNLGVHWPSDVLASWLIGASCLLLAAMRRKRPAADLH